jgi:hypothetical protein
MMRQCEGYCGGMVEVGKTRTTQDGERFCEDCFEDRNLNPPCPDCGFSGLFDTHELGDECPKCGWINR